MQMASQVLQEPRMVLHVTKSFIAYSSINISMVPSHVHLAMNNVHAWIYRFRSLDHLMLQSYVSCMCVDTCQFIFVIKIIDTHKCTTYKS